MSDRKHSRSFAFRPVWAGGLLWAAACAAGATASAPIVGVATLVIGVARVISPSGEAATVDRGTPIRVGDRVETQAGGHVHLRFVDGGRVSVRPSSRLQIENYSHSADVPALNAIKFRLDEGVVRSITGTWGEAARDKFRLNTPVAAIGVKGTDFVARTRGGTTFASVYAGAIALTPLAGGCQGSLGPCLNGAEKLLTADMKGQTLELARMQGTAQVVPSIEHIALGTRTTAAPAASTKLSDADPTVVEKVVASEQKVNAVQTFLAAVGPVTAPGAGSGSGGSAGGADTAGGSTPIVATRPPVVDQLAWGRWGTYDVTGSPVPVAAPIGDKISIASVTPVNNGGPGPTVLMDASKAGWEYVSPGSVAQLDSGYRIFRDPAAGSAPISGEVKADFRLAGAAANLTRAGGVLEAASVDKGTLSMDFVRNTYDTSLTITNPTIKTVTLEEKGGTIDKATGVLTSPHTSGIVTNDRSQAAYYFNRTLTEGELKGITLWGR